MDGPDPHAEQGCRVGAKTQNAESTPLTQWRARDPSWLERVRCDGQWRGDRQGPKVMRGKPQRNF